jgi:large conductance mechanosensitive channel
MGMVKEFRDFAMRGNVMDMAVGVVIGAAFGKIVTSLVGDIIMPAIGKITGGVNFSDLFIVLGEGEYESLVKAKEAGAPVIAYGVFINTLIDFIIIAFAIFMVVKMINTARKRFEKKQEAAPPPPPPKQEVLLEEIRDLLKKQVG